MPIDVIFRCAAPGCHAHTSGEHHANRRLMLPHGRCCVYVRIDSGSGGPGKSQWDEAEDPVICPDHVAAKLQSTARTLPKGAGCYIELRGWV